MCLVRILFDMAYVSNRGRLPDRSHMKESPYMVFMEIVPREMRFLIHCDTDFAFNVKSLKSDHFNNFTNQGFGDKMKEVYPTSGV